MESSNTQSEDFDEQKSLQTIQEMLQISKRKFQSDGVLFIVWGWIMASKNLLDFIMSKADLAYKLVRNIELILIAIAISGLIYTVYYILRQRKRVQTYIGISLRYVWVSMFFSLVLVNIIRFRVLEEINFELQHPIFMVIIAFATVVTGGILRYNLIVYGGVTFALLAFISSRLQIEYQLLMESIAWFIAFVIPGHILYSQRNK